MGEKSGNGDSSAGKAKGLAEEEEVGGMGREGKHTRRKGEIPRVNNNGDFVSGGGGGVSYFSAPLLKSDVQMEENAQRVRLEGNVRLVKRDICA